MDDDPPSQSRAATVHSLLHGKRLLIRRARVVPFLSIRPGRGIRSRFKTPCPHLRTAASDEQKKRRTLGVKRRRTGASTYVRSVENAGVSCDNMPLFAEDVESEEEEKEEVVVDDVVMREFVPLVLWEPTDTVEEGGEPGKPVVVDPILCQWLRAHQREGLQFVFDCIIGRRGLDVPVATPATPVAAAAAAAAVAAVAAADGASAATATVAASSASTAVGGGCILADDMGLGKTLQAIALLWTMLKQGARCGHPVSRAIIVTPTSLIFNWQAELKKWLGDRVKSVALMCTSRADVLSGIREFLSPRRGHPDVLIISYETFRLHVSQFDDRPDCCDLMILDEAHRMKNGDCLTTRTLDSIPCTRRLLLTGTPMQNDLKEFYAMMNFTNHGCVGKTASAFSKKYGRAIVAAQEPDASDGEQKRGAKASNALALVVNEFVLRRTNALLADHLPDRVTFVVCIRPTPLQVALYSHFVAAKIAAQSQRALPCITILKKICNHPKLVWDAVGGASSVSAHGLRECVECFPEGYGGDANRRGGARGSRRSQNVDPNLSGKFGVLAAMLAELRATTDDRIVVVSNYVEQLELVGKLCRAKKYPFVCLDGSTTARKRQQHVNDFNDKSSDVMVFLLSAKAGGCGLNLIGGNRLVLFDPDWVRGVLRAQRAWRRALTHLALLAPPSLLAGALQNPAIDKQVAGRVWRDGQTKRTFIYRFVTTGTIEEKVYQRQLMKEGLQTLVVDQKEAGTAWSTEGVKDIFQLHLDTASETHDELHCVRCGYIGSGDGGPSVADAEDCAFIVDDGEGAGGDDDFEDSDDFFFEEDSDDNASDATAVPGAAVIRGAGVTQPSATLEAALPAQASAAAASAASPPVPPVGDVHIQSEDNYDDLSTWGHHATLGTVPDPILVAASCGRVSFVFQHLTKGGTQRDEVADRAAAVAAARKPKKKRLGGGRRRRHG
jgi:DNA repair and recombination RAD54-like protein